MDAPPDITYMSQTSKEFKNLGEMRKFMGINNQDVFTESDDRIGRPELKRGSGNQSGIDGMLLDPMLGRLLESMLKEMPKLKGLKEIF